MSRLLERAYVVMCGGKFSVFAMPTAQLIIVPVAALAAKYWQVAAFPACWDPTGRPR
ncbi:MAG TPA: hypothetical protein VHQ22_18415 [Terriglobales bacterium]|nr:hypothetical protein [Terriglobales bacterium]